MCREVEQLYRTSDLPDRKILVMAGHEEGIISFGHTCEEAFQVLVNYYLRSLAFRYYSKIFN
jgi:hypothetical protein